MERSNLPTNPQSVLNWQPMRHGVTVSKVLADVHEILDNVAHQYPYWSVKWEKMDETVGGGRQIPSSDVRWFLTVKAGLGGQD